MRKADLHTIIDHVPVALCVVDSERRMLYANPALAELTGTPPDQAASGGPGDALGCIHALEDARGCGLGQRCSECKVRLAVDNTFSNGQENRDVEEQFTVARDEERREITVLASTNRILLDGRDAVLLSLQDITERREQESSYRAFYHNAPFGIYRTTPAGEILMANAALLGMLGYESFEQLAERNLSEESQESGYPRAEFIEQLERDGYISGFEAQWTRAEGLHKWFRENAWLVRDAAGRVRYYEGTVEDATALEESEERRERLYQDQRVISEIASAFVQFTPNTLDTLLESALGTVGRHLSADRVQVFLLSDDGAQMSNTYDWCASGVAPRTYEIRSYDPARCSWFKNRMVRGEPIQIPDVSALSAEPKTEFTEFLPHDVWSLICLPMWDENGELSGFLGCEMVRKPREWLEREIGLLRTIAELLSSATIRSRALRQVQSSEEKLRTILDNVTDVVWSLSYPELQTLFISPSVEALYGYSVETFLNSPSLWQEFVHPEDRHTTEEALAQLEEHGAAERVCRIIRPDGELRWIVDRSHFVYDEAGNAVRIDGIASEITARKTAELELEETAAALRERIKERDALAAVWDAWREQRSFDDVLQQTVNTLPSGFQYPLVTCARVMLAEKRFVSEGFSETRWSLAEDIPVNGKPAGTVTVCHLEEMPAAEFGPFITEEVRLIQHIAEQIGHLAEVEQMLETLRVQAVAMENAGSGIVIADALRPNHPIVYVNKEFERLTGYSEADALGRNPRFLHRGDAGQAGLEEIRAGIKEQRECRAVLRNFRKNGESFWCELKIAPVRNEAGVFTHYIGVFSDVTTTLEMGKELLENERRLRLSQEYAGIGTWDWNLTTDQILWSEQSGALLGYEQATRVDTYERFLASVHPEDRDALDGVFRECLETGDAFHTEYRYIRPDGSVRWFMGSGNVSYDAAGKPERLLGIIEDINERKDYEAEIRFQQQFQAVLAENAAEFIAVGSDGLDEAISVTLKRIGEFFELNRSAIVLFSQDCLTVANAYEWCREPLESRRSALYQLPDGKVKWCEGLQLEVNTPVRVPRIERLPSEAVHAGALLDALQLQAAVLLPLFGGERIRGVLVLGAPPEFLLWNEAWLQGLGMIVQAIADALDRIETHRDLTRLKTESDEARVGAETANRAKSEFLSSMSHELRTPLNAILGFSQLLSNDNELSAKHRDFASEVVTAGNHLLALVNEVLDLARIESGRIDLAFDSVSVIEVLRESLSLVEPSAREHGIRLELDHAAGIQVRADRVRLKQVVVNLVSNAVKYNRADGSVTVTVTARESAVRVSVTDSGEGIPEEKLEKLFTRFNRLGRETGTIEGAGIGLALSKRIIELMDGAIGVESVVGEGSTFWVELPAGKQEKKQPADVGADQPASGVGDAVGEE